MTTLQVARVLAFTPAPTTLQVSRIYLQSAASAKLQVATIRLVSGGTKLQVSRIIALSNALVSVTPDMTVESGTRITLTGTDNGVSRSWRFNGAVISTQNSVIVNAPVVFNETVFDYVYTALDSNGTPTSASVSVTVRRATIWEKNNDGSFTPYVIRVL